MTKYLKLQTNSYHQSWGQWLNKRIIWYVRDMVYSFWEDKPYDIHVIPFSYLFALNSVIYET